MKKIVLLFCVVLMFIMTGCAKDVTVNIIDSGIITQVEAKTGMSISEILDKAGINPSTKDEVEPLSDSKLTEDVSEIVVKRYAKVQVKKGFDIKNIEMVGGTVKDAVEKSGFKVEKDEVIDPGENEYLKDGMLVRITKELSLN